MEELDVQAVSHANSCITTNDGKLQLQFSTKSSDVELVCEVNCNGIGKALLSNCVSRSTQGRNTQFGLDLPGPGEYAVNVFAYRKDDPTRLHHIYTYLVTSNQTSTDNKHRHHEGGQLHASC